MGTGAVYVTLYGLKDRSSVVATIETGFYFLNMALFLLNTVTLLLQAIRTSMYLSRHCITHISIQSILVRPIDS